MTIAEESTSYPGVTKPIAEGGLNFDYKWNMGWMHDSLNYFKEDPLYRKYHHNKLTFGMLYHWSESFIQSFSHDEVVHGKGSLMGKMGGGDFANKAANLRCLLALQWAWPGKKSLFMGCEFGQIAEWSHSRSLDWHLLQYPLQEGIQKLVADLNALYKKDKTIAERDFDSQGFNWVHADDGDQSVLIFERHGYDCSWVVVGNFTPVERTYRFGVPCLGKWEEAINTDSSYYAGRGSGNLGGVVAEKIPAHGRPQSIEVCLPGLSVVIFRLKTKG
jgi:1,4-alpha-glucan branching enzyme